MWGAWKWKTKIMGERNDGQGQGRGGGKTWEGDNDGGWNHGGGEAILSRFITSDP